MVSSRFPTTPGVAAGKKHENPTCCKPPGTLARSEPPISVQRPQTLSQRGCKGIPPRKSQPCFGPFFREPPKWIFVCPFSFRLNHPPPPKHMGTRPKPTSRWASRLALQHGEGKAELRQGVRQVPGLRVSSPARPSGGWW